MRPLTVATRGGDLALAQTQIVIDLLKKNHPNLKINKKVIATKGDKDLKTTLWQLKDTGFFTSQLEEILLSGDADFAVHSFKDLPTKEREGLTIAAVCDRRYVEDCLIAREKISSIPQLPKSAKIGTSSLRRAVQLKRLRDDLHIVPIRGNVGTRLNILKAGRFPCTRSGTGFDAVILARAGLERLGLGDEISFIFEPAEFIPAPAQGALAVQVRSDEREVADIISTIDDRNARITSLAERQILITTRCGCHAPVGAFGKITGETIEISAFISDPEGTEFVGRKIAGSAGSAIELADKLAGELLCAGKSK